MRTAAARTHITRFMIKTPKGTHATILQTVFVDKDIYGCGKNGDTPCHQGCP